eukprot:8785391-Ditylum_brightwellii.AAC.1
MSLPTPTFSNDDELKAVLADLNIAHTTVPSESLARTLHMRGDVKLIFLNGQDTKPPARANIKAKSSLLLDQNNKGHIIQCTTDTDVMCMGLVGASRTKLCTHYMCSTRVHRNKFAASTGVYLKGGSN